MKLEASGIEKWYFRRKGDSNRFFAVQRTDLTLLPGTVTVLTGRSGSGKTTLMNMMSGLLTPGAGQVLADGKDLYAMGDHELSRFRNLHFGMIPQSAGLLQTLTVSENIRLVRGLYGHSGEEADPAPLLERLGMEGLLETYPKELSGGELRRAAVVRALYGKPDVIFADEPTSDLDDENMMIVLAMLREAADSGAAVMIVTHDSEALDFADQAYRMDGGCLL